MRSIIPRLHARGFAYLVILAGFGCAPAAQTIYVAASTQTVLSHLEAAPTGGDQNVVVENHSSQEIFVTGVSLRECRNIKNACETAPMRVKVAPGERRRVLTVRQDKQNQSTGFRYGTSWEVAAAVIPPIP